MRCFKDIATAGTGLVDAEAVQPEYHAFLAQQEFIRAKGSLSLHGVLATFCRPVMETVQFCHLENLEKIGRKYGENFWNILVLPSTCALVLNEKVPLECFLHFLRFSDMSRLHLSNLFDTSMFMRSACIPCTVYWSTLRCKAFVLRFGKLHF